MPKAKYEKKVSRWCWKIMKLTGPMTFVCQPQPGTFLGEKFTSCLNCASNVAIYFHINIIRREPHALHESSINVVPLSLLCWMSSNSNITLHWSNKCLRLCVYNSRTGSTTADGKYWNVCYNSQEVKLYVSKRTSGEALPWFFFKKK